MTGYSIILNVCVESIKLKYIIVGAPGPGERHHGATAVPGPRR